MEPCSGLSSTIAAQETPSGTDLLGWSALPLLGGGIDRTEPWLFVSSRSFAWLSRGPLGDAQFVRKTSDYARSWPFGDGALGGAVIDGDALSRGAHDTDLQRMVAEACRTTGRQGDVLLVCGHRLVPGRLWMWREYRRPSAHRWRRAATRLGMRAETAGVVELDGDRIAGLRIVGQDHSGASASKGTADRLVLRVAASGRRETQALEAMVAHVSRSCGTTLGIDRVAVRKIGKTAVFVSGTDGRRYVVRIARSPIALARATRNFEALRWLHDAPLADSIVGRVPVAAVQGRHAAYNYYVESCLDGQPGTQSAGGPGDGGWRMQAVDFITSLHAETVQRTMMDEDAMSRLVREPASRVARACGSADAERQVQRVVRACEASLRGRLVPLVRTHGDFTDSNCLFDASGTLTAVVDWEVSMAQGLPFLDLLQLMPIPGETGSSPRWQRFDAWLEIWRNSERVASDPVLGRYLRALDLQPEVVSGLILAQWLTHVGDRIVARREDERWMRLRVAQPLDSFGRTLRD